MRHLIVGDIHGCRAELEELLDKAGLGAEDRIIALGDIVDRGPDSPGVLKFFADTPRALAIMGNHERKHVRAQRGEIEAAPSQIIARQQIGEADYPAACAWMARMPRFVELPEAILVHGLFEPGLALERQWENVIVGTLSGERHVRMRYDRPWYELYDGPKPLVVGHHNYTRTREPLIVGERVYAIDTGCCHGNALTGLLLPEFKIISVPSRANYWAELQRQFAHLFPPRAP